MAALSMAASAKEREAVAAGAYMEVYFDETLDLTPERCQRLISEILKLDCDMLTVYRKITEFSEEYSRAEVDPSRKVAIREKIRRCLLAMETILNEKLRHSGEITERLETAKHNLQQKWKAIETIRQSGDSPHSNASTSALIGPRAPRLFYISRPRTTVISQNDRNLPEEESGVGGGGGASSKSPTRGSEAKRPRRQKIFPDFVSTNDELPALDQQIIEFEAAVVALDQQSTESDSFVDQVVEKIVTEKASVKKERKITQKKMKYVAKITRRSVPVKGPGKSPKSLRPRPKRHQEVAVVSKRTQQPSGEFTIPAEPGEPIYCLCEKVSYGDMIGCDNDDCEIEWFHFQCVKLTSKPKGKWFCPSCRGDKANVQKSDAKT